MSLRRFPNASTVSSEILGEQLCFPNGCQAQNRFLKAALTEILSTYSPDEPKKHGLPTDSILNIYDKWGHGKFGMILTSNVLVDPTNLEAAGNAIIYQEGECHERRALFTHWAKLMKQDGALAVMQLSHAGRQTPSYVNPTPWSASDIQLVSGVRYTTYGKPKPLSTEQVKTEVVDRFVYAAKYAYECGFHGIQLHAAHGYLLSQFTSPTTNKRTDKYGGSLENRQRVILEIYNAIRAEIPASTGFLVGIKTNSVEFQAEGTTLEQGKEMCRVYEESGFDFVELSGGTYEKMALCHERESTKKREAFFLEFAEQIRPVFNKTVVYLTGGFRSVSAMVAAISSNATQGIGLGRPITAEPDLPKKILEGSVPSAVQDQFDPNQLTLTALASGTQMEQMGRTSVKSVGGNVMHQVSDFSCEELVQKYIATVGNHLQQVSNDGKRAKSVIVINYYPNHYDELVNQATQTFPAFWESYFMNNPVFQTFQLPKTLANDYKRTAVQLMKDQKIQEELRSHKYDVMIVEAFELSGFYVAHLIGIPSIPVISAVRSEPTSELFGQKSVLGFVAREGSRMAPDAGFFERLNDVYRDFLWKKTLNILGDLQYSNIQGAIDRPVPYWKDLVKQSPIFITNSNPYLDFAVPATPAIVNAGGITMDVHRKPEKLTEDYEMILKERDFTILISFGSVIRSFQMPDHFKYGLIKMFESLPDVTFIWKYENEDSKFQKELPTNVHLKPWVPQTALLSDKRLKLFITHGGLGSTMELAYSGTPALMVPVFADQFQNAAMLSRHGGAVVYDKYDLQDGEKLAGIVKEIIMNPKYKWNAERLLRVLSNQPIDVKENLMKQVDFAIE
ncbi:hypothetical protein L3Y34_006844 [Caenorhabditis briggsae]|uniref:glucuronosyltransferase n=1 Tax=Caenorhabditis briggsae TaxID=6238 RepID=A0AAE9D020_CAEBR|nr:hypothetical protein L3Y34_006844 [Caenorhabditis briggsae]